MRKLILLICFSIVILPLKAEKFYPKDIFELRSVVEVKFSPNGKYLAYTLNVPRPLEDGKGTDYRELYIYDLKEKKDKPFITGNNRIYNIDWTPDSRYITFLARRDDDKLTSLYRIPVDGGEAQKVFEPSGSILGYKFDKSGRFLAYITLEPEDSIKKQIQDEGYDLRIYEEEWRHRDLHLYDFEENEDRRLTRGISIFDFIWHPDGKQIIASAIDKNLVDYRYMFRRLYRIRIDGGAINQLVENPGKLGQYALSPDGKWLAFISAEDINDPREGTIYLMELDNPRPFNQLRNLTPDFKGTVSSLSWRTERELLYTSDEGVYTTLRRIDIKKNKSKKFQIPSGVIFRRFTINKDQVAFAGNTWQHPGELYLFSLKKGSLEQLTEHNAWLKEKDFGRQERIEYRSRDGLMIEGVLIYPVDYQEGKRYPLIVVVHGGPESCFLNGWVTWYSRWGQIAASEGYFVFMPNYRGSTGRGDEFSRLDQQDLAGKEFDDILAGIDYLVEQGLVDGERIGIGGGSYGGYLSAWAATRFSDRFKAAVVFVGISDQISKRFTTDIPYEAYYVHWLTWVDENFELIWDRSPVKWARGSHTPTLILHGDRDPRVHPSQSLELYRALKLHGQAPVRLVYYPGEGHGNRLNFNKWDYLLRTLRWFNLYVKETTTDTLPPRYPVY